MRFAILPPTTRSGVSLLWSLACCGANSLLSQRAHDRVSPPQLDDEIDLLTRATHANVIAFHAAFVHPEKAEVSLI